MFLYANAITLNPSQVYSLKVSSKSIGIDSSRHRSLIFSGDPLTYSLYVESEKHLLMIDILYKEELKSNLLKIPILYSFSIDLIK